MVFKMASPSIYPKLQVFEMPTALTSSRGFNPVVDYAILHRAVEIDAAIREWRSPLPQNDFSNLIYLLYKQMLWIYLWRTIYPLKFTSSVPDHKITSAVKDGVALLESFPPKNPVQTLLLAPTFIMAVVLLTLCREARSGVPYIQLKNIPGLGTQI